ncbi:Mitochondrial import receptor subunit TOM22-like [Cricetulus griseus]|uniref:Mitochondrial import receptor subunit TOM22 homolog n=1 Tax=Cricetulus griseus TaxID=10029 RepID=G3I2J8_CRIGR|nr:Mitochondrial import receptor subunit TOM22-like [Cricetulus griseus]
MNLAGQNLKFENGQWVADTVISGGVDRRETQRLRKRNQQLEEENNLLRLKVDILLDMVHLPSTFSVRLPEETLSSGGLLSPAPFRFRCPTAMAAAVAAAGAGEPLSPDELLPKAEVEKAEEELEEDEDDELDETLSERLWGLTEMFPERVRSAAGATFDLSLFVAQKMYRFSRAALWIGTTSFMILVLPVVFETEKLQMEQQQQLQQRQCRLHRPKQIRREEPLPKKWLTTTDSANGPKGPAVTISKVG